MLPRAVDRCRQVGNNLRERVHCAGAPQTWRNFSFLGLLFGLLALGVVLGSAAILAVATGLTYVFSVSVWEAAVVVTAVSAAVYLTFMFRPVADEPFDHLPEPPYDEDAIPRIVIADLPDPPNRSRRRRRRL